MAFDKNIVSEDEVLAYLGIDVADDMVKLNVDLMRQAAASFLNGAIANNLEKSEDGWDARAKMLALAAIADMYDNRSYNDYSNKASITVRKLVQDFSLQLILEARGEEK